MQKSLKCARESLLYWRLPSDWWFCLKRDEVLFVSALQEFSPNRCHLFKTLHSNCRGVDQHLGASFTPRRRQVKQKSSWQALCLQNLAESWKQNGLTDPLKSPARNLSSSQYGIAYSARTYPLNCCSSGLAWSASCPASSHSHCVPSRRTDSP